jgi:hypothetical protein
MYQIYFVPKIVTNSDGKKRLVFADTEVKIQLIEKTLRDILYGKECLTNHQKDHMLDVIDSLEEVLKDFGEPGDSFGEPAIRLDEMHAAAWQQHQEMHS